MTRLKTEVHLRAAFRMEASAREYGLSFSFGANPEVFKRMSAFNAEVGERRFNSQVLIRPQGILTSFKSRTNPFRSGRVLSQQNSLAPCNSSVITAQ